VAASRWEHSREVRKNIAFVAVVVAAAAVLCSLAGHAVDSIDLPWGCHSLAGTAHAAHQQVNVSGLIYCLGGCRMNRQNMMADHEMVVGPRIQQMEEDSGVAEVVLLRDEVVVHRCLRHRKAMEAVPTDLACPVVEGVGSCCATLRRSRLPTYDARDLVVDERMNLVAHASDRRHSHPP
jgi:hypothetical protein